MASLDEFENSMTIYYYKSNGDIHSYCTGINDMTMFGEHADDYAAILDYLIHNWNNSYIAGEPVVSNFDLYKFPIILKEIA